MEGKDKTVYITGLKELPEEKIKEAEEINSCLIKRSNKIPDDASLLIVDLTEEQEYILFDIEKKEIPFIAALECAEKKIRRALDRGAVDFLIKDESKNYIKIFPHYLKHVFSHIEIMEQYYEEKHIFSELSENAIFGIYVFGKDLKFRYVNPSLLKVFDLSTDEVYRKVDVLSIIHPDDKNIVREKIKSRFEGKEKIAEYSFRIIDKKGNVRWVHAKGFVSEFCGEEVIMGTLIDITDLKKYQEEIEKEKREIEETLKDSVYAISRVVEVKDPYTANHQVKVAEIAERVAKEFNFDEEKLKEILWAGLLHDIGKIAVPAELLSKPSTLTDLEYSIIKQHPVAGYRILKEIHRMGKIAEIVWQHHERLDGSGYPRGLRDGEITFEARLLAVVDVIEAMRSHRPYRPARSKEEIMKELIYGKGKKYDPKIVDVIIDLINKGEIELTQAE